MKIFTHVVTLAFFLFFFSFSALAQRSPCLCVEGYQEVSLCTTNPAPNTTGNRPPMRILSNNAVSFKVSDNPYTLEAINREARYKAFWIFGDGNFRIYPHSPDKAIDEATLLQPYIYRKEGTYRVRAILSEKKSDDDVAEETVRSVQVNSLPTPATGRNAVFIKRLNTNTTLDIFPSELRRPKHPTAFAVSAQPDKSNVGVFFFFNCYKSKRLNGQFVAGDKVDSLGGVELPFYMTGAGITNTVGRTSALPSLIRNAAERLVNQYANYIYVPYSAAAEGAMPSTFDEYRFFPVLHTIWRDTANPLVDTRVAALLVGIEPLREQGQLAILNSTLEGMGLGGIDGYVIGDTSLASASDSTQIFLRGERAAKFAVSSPIYIRGAAVLTTEMVGVIDPNNLQVTRICPGEEPGFYKAEVNMQVCNKGFITENDASIELTGDNSFTEFKILHNEGTISAQALMPNGLSFHWGVLGAIERHDGGHSEYSPTQPNCLNLAFEVKTNWAGAQNLAQGKGLKLCVAFSQAMSGKPECNDNAPFDATKLSPQKGYQCGDKCVCSWWYILLIVLGALLLAWLWWRKS